MRFGAWVSVSVSAVFCTGLGLAGPSTAAHQQDGRPVRRVAPTPAGLGSCSRPRSRVAPGWLRRSWATATWLVASPSTARASPRSGCPARTDPLPTQSQVHGLYALGIPAAPPGSPPQPPVERRAALPAWSTLSYDDGSGAYALSRGEVAGYRQALDMRTGTLTTSLTWTSPAGRKVDLRYDVTPDRAHRRAAVVRLRIVPRFSGPVTVTDTLDGRAAELLDPKGTGHALAAASGWTSPVRASAVRATEASTLVGGPVHAVRLRRTR